MEDRNLSLSEVAGLTGVSERTVRRWIKSGKLRAYKPGRDYRIPEAALREFIEESEVSPKGTAPPSLQASFNGLLAEERRKPEYLQEHLRGRGIEVNNSEAILLAQYLKVHEHPPTGPYVIGHVVRESEPVDHERVLTMLAYVIATGMLSRDETEAVRETLHRELVSPRS